MIESVKIKNLRSLIDTGFINIKKINILLGANSSGKSTFLRSFPLFTQSVKKNLRGPISWFDDSYVDFGDYQTAKNKYVDKDEHICFSYVNFNRLTLLYRPIFVYYFYLCEYNDERKNSTYRVTDAAIHVVGILCKQLRILKFHTRARQKSQSLPLSC